jgi:hypothetical protein
MATEETREEPAPLAANPEGHLVTFLPHLRLKSSHRVGGVEFVPLRGEDGTVSSSLESVARPLDKILSGYVDRKGKALTNCVVATIPGRGGISTERISTRYGGRCRCCSSGPGRATSISRDSVGTT